MKKTPTKAVVINRQAEGEEKNEEPKQWPPSGELRAERKTIDRAIKALKKTDSGAHAKFVEDYQLKQFSPNPQDEWYEVTNFERN